MSDSATTGQGLGGAVDFLDFAAARGAHLYKTAYLLTGGDRYLAEDLVQEALSRLFVRWQRVSRLENTAGYAQTVLVNTFLSYRRRRSSGEKTAYSLPDAAVSEGDPALRVTLLQALQAVSAKDRAVLVLRYWEDRSIEETAAALELSSTAVRSRAHRALGRMRALLGESFAEHVAE